MTLRYDVLTPGGDAAGKLDIRPIGVKTGFEYESGTLFPPSRLVLITPGGPFSLGIPAPRDGQLYLKKLLSPLSLSGVDLTGELSALLVPADTDLSSLSPPAPAEKDCDIADAGYPADVTAVPDTPEERSDDSPYLPAIPAMAADPAAVPPADGAGPDAGTPAGPASVPDIPDSWTPEPDPARYFSDPDLICAARKIEGAMVKSDGPDTLLAFPFSPSMPFPMLPAFRFGAAQELDGGSYIVFRVRDGAPI